MNPKPAVVNRYVYTASEAGPSSTFYALSAVLDVGDALGAGDGGDVWALGE